MKNTIGIISDISTLQRCSRQTISYDTIVLQNLTDIDYSMGDYPLPSFEAKELIVINCNKNTTYYLLKGNRFPNLSKISLMCHIDPVFLHYFKAKKIEVHTSSQLKD